MKSVRILYSKTGDARFISHLDINRFWSRQLRKAQIPLWYTEGFNPRIYTKFALPLSLGFESESEFLDIRLLDDNFPLEQIMCECNKIAPKEIMISKVFEPINDFSKISFAEYEVTIFSQNDNLFNAANSFFAKTEIMLTRTNKKGVTKEFNVADDIENLQIECIEGGIKINLVLPAGNTNNVNPTLIFDAFSAEFFEDLDIHYNRKLLLLEDKTPFA